VRNFKWRGEIAELGFLHKLAGMGFAVTKPYGGSESYDFIVDSGNRLWRVQVKSGSSMKRERAGSQSGIFGANDNRNGHIQRSRSIFWPRMSCPQMRGTSSRYALPFFQYRVNAVSGG
jgi:hypothetical protein